MGSDYAIRFRLCTLQNTPKLQHGQVVKRPRRFAEPLLSSSLTLREAGQRHYHHGIHQFRRSQSNVAGLCDNKGCDPELHGGSCPAVGREGGPRRCGRTGAVWTPLIPSTLPEDAVTNFGKQVPKRPGQPAELATAFVMLADPLSSYVSGATIAVTGGKPIL
jgi:hypothetical protein